MFKVKKKAKITSVQFELEVKTYLESTSGRLKQFQTEHRESMDGHDGTYEIDITARFRIFGADFLVLVECKHHKNRIKREHVQMLHAKLVTLGAQKAMLFSTSEFQEGAVEYAIQHGILWSGLLQAKLRILPEVRTLRPCLIHCPLTLDGSLPNTTGRVEA